MTAISDFSGTPKETSLKDLLAAVDRDGQVAGREGHLTGVDELLEPVADDPERRVADADDIGRAEQLRAALGDRLAVDVRAVVRAQVADLHAAVGRRVELGVVPGDLEVRDHQLVLQGTADAHHAAEGELVERGRAAVAVDRRRPRDAAGALLLRRDVRRGLLLRLLPAGLGLLLRGPGAAGGGACVGGCLLGPAGAARPAPRTAAAGAGPAAWRRRPRRPTGSGAGRRSRCPGAPPIRSRAPSDGSAAPARTCRWCCHGPR
ncbi:hypothetical protein SVIOM74S_10460 [Streptomyces violarus]